MMAKVAWYNVFPFRIFLLFISIYFHESLRRQVICEIRHVEIDYCRNFTFPGVYFSQLINLETIRTCVSIILLEIVLSMLHCVFIKF